MATAQLQQPEGLVTQADALLKLLGGTKTTSSPGDTGALEKTFADLQGTDYEAMLKAIFQQAGGQIPGLQQALGNAIGARSGGNSAVAAALQKLLAQTSTGAMDQVAKLQAQNFQTQANVGGNIAQATKGTNVQTGTNVSSGLTEAAKLIALLQGAKQLGADKWLKGLTSDTPEAAVSPAMTTAANNAFASPTAPLSTAETPMFNLGGSFTPAAGQPGVSSDVPGVPQITDPGFQYTDMTGFQQPYQAPTYTPSFEVAPAPIIPLDTYEETYTFADGGLVKKAEGYADGGTVRAGGSRRSANPAVEIRDPEQILAQLASSQLSGAFPQAQALAAPTATASGADMANVLASSGSLDSGSGSFSGSPGATSGGMDPRDFGNAINKAGAISNISGALGGPTLGQAGGVLGLAAGLANAPSNEAALGVMGKFGANMAVPGLGSAIGFAQNPTQVGAINTLSMLNPIGALWGGVSALTGAPSLGEVALGAPQSITGSPISGGLVNEATTGLFGGGGQFGGDPAMSSPVTGWGPVTSTDLGMLGGGSDSSGPSSTGGTDGMGDAASAGVGGGGFADGGTPEGVSDKLTIKVSPGEYIMSADVVEKLGEEFFNQLQTAFHVPAAQQRKQG